MAGLVLRWAVMLVAVVALSVVFGIGVRAVIENEAIAFAVSFIGSVAIGWAGGTLAVASGWLYRD